MAPSNNDPKSKTQKPAAKVSAAKPAKPSTDKPAARATVIAVVAPATDPACPLPPKAKTHVVLLDADAKVGDRVMCENNHLLVVVSLTPLQLAKA
jgi:hypothetical protein